MAAIDTADAILLVGSNIRHEAPLLGQRVRKAWRKGAQKWRRLTRSTGISISAWTDALIAAPQNMVTELAAIAKAVARLTGKEFPGALQTAVSANNAEAQMTSHNAIAEITEWFEG